MKKEIGVNLLDRFVPEFPTFNEGFGDSMDGDFFTLKNFEDPLISTSKSEQDQDLSLTFSSLPSHPAKLTKTLSNTADPLFTSLCELETSPFAEGFLDLEDLSPASFPSAPSAAPLPEGQVKAEVEERAEEEEEGEEEEEDSEMSASDDSGSEEEEEEPAPVKKATTKKAPQQPRPRSHTTSRSSSSSSSSPPAKGPSSSTASSQLSTPRSSGRTGSPLPSSPSSPGGGGDDDHDPRRLLSQKVSADGVEKPQKKKPGRKPKILDEQTRLERGRLRQEKNRLAAKKCREKKQQFYLDLEQEVEVLRKEKEEMGKEILLLRHELTLLKGAAR